jgi:hypothetical protein
MLSIGELFSDASSTLARRPLNRRRSCSAIVLERGNATHYHGRMSRCTAPVWGHRSASAAEACPACRGRSSGYRSYSYSPPSYTPSYPSYTPSGSSGGGGGGQSSRPRWSRPGSAVIYTPAEVRTLTPVRDNIEKRPEVPDQRVLLKSTSPTCVPVQVRSRARLKGRSL